MYFKPKQLEKHEAIIQRILTFNDFLNNIESDLKRLSRITGFRAFLAMEDYIASHGVFLNNTEETFKEVFYSGFVNGVEEPIMENSSLKYYLEHLQEKASQIGLSLTITVENISLRQVSPWTVEVALTLTINASDVNGLMSWNYQTTTESEFSIIDLRDPLYSVNTAGKVHNTIRQSNVTDFIIGDNDTSPLMQHVINGFYKASTKAPSFLMRFTNNLSNSSFGIESLVYIPLLTAQNLQVDESKSIVDYLYFSNVTGTAQVYDCENLPEWFRIDYDHESDYDIDSLNCTR